MRRVYIRSKEFRKLKPEIKEFHISGVFNFATKLYFQGCKTISEWENLHRFKDDYIFSFLPTSINDALVPLINFYEIMNVVNKLIFDLDLYISKDPHLPTRSFIDERIYIKNPGVIKDFLSSR